MATCALALLVGRAQAAEEDSLETEPLPGYVTTEFNAGHTQGEAHPWLVDFPHVIGGATLNLGRGWSAVAEVEYERFYSDGRWGNNFRNNYTTNKLYINKEWNPALNLKLGIIDVPVGTTNSGGPALTIYDPLGESTLMPMTWHEGGAALWGKVRKLHYQVGAYVYPTAPLKESRLLGAAARLGYELFNGLDLSLSYFYGSAKEGMVQRQNPNLAEYSHVYHAAFDFAYLAYGWVVDGQLVASSCHNNRAAGMEVGYDVAPLMGAKSCSLIPFARYDGYYHVEGASCNKFTLGVNTTLPLGFTFKMEAARSNPTDSKCSTSLNIGIGWQGEF